MVALWLVDASRPLHLWQQCLMIVTFLGLNASLNYLNKRVLGSEHFGFHFPAVMTLCHLLFGFMALFPVMLTPRFRGLHRATLVKQWKGILAVGSFSTLNILLNNLSMVYVGLSLIQIIRSGIPLFVAMLGVVVEKKIPTRMEFVGIVVLTLGVVTSIYEGSAVDGSTFGIIVCLTGTVCGAGYLSFSGAVLAEKLDVLRLTFYTAPISCLILLSVVVGSESSGLVDFWYTKSHDVMFYIMAGAANAVVYNISHYLVIQRTSAVTTPVIGMIKVIAIVVLSAVFLGEKDIFTVKMTCGCILAIIGGGLYSQAKMRSHRRDQVPDLPVLTGPADLQRMKPSKSGLPSEPQEMIETLMPKNYSRRDQSPSRRTQQVHAQAV